MKIDGLNFLFLSFILFLNSVSSQLSPTQKSSMINLSEHLHSQVSSFSWDTNKDPCTWTGVACNNLNNSVIKISLSSLKLTSSNFLPIACQIPSLEVLDVSKNLLNSIPVEFLSSCGDISTLRSVNFSWNRVSGPLPSFENGFTNLEALDLSQNLLSGSIGTQLNALVSLKSLNLSSNSFNGSIPTNFGEVKGLEQLQLSANIFQGTIPEQLADYRNLTFLDLSSNLLNGEIPSRIQELPKLEVLVLSGNKLSGEVPDLFSNNTRLQRFAANQNEFYGSVPSGITRYLKTLDLSYNNLSGSIPNDLLSQPNLQKVDLSYNRLIGTISGNVSSSLVRLRLGGNLLQGSISPINFRNLQSLEYLELENNNLIGKLPVDLCSCQKLSLLNLAENKLSGELPTELGNLKQLQVLSLQLNNFVGNIPSEITQLSKLTSLNISWNLLSGPIPPSILFLERLEYLHLQENKLSGSIPRTIGNLNSKNLIELQLGQNHLSGKIPLMPPLLQYSLNLSHNFFEGQIPKSLDQITSLEILDLSNNRFSGEIPDFLTTMRSLTWLLLDNNNLSGVIPTFPSTVIVDTKGNLGLNYPPPDSPNTNHGKMSIAVKIAVVVSAALFGGLIAILGVFLSMRLLYKVHDIDVQSRQPDLPVPLAVESHILTTNSTHKSNIDFTKAMEAVSNPLNLVLKTKFSTYYKAVIPSGVSYFVKKLNCTDRIFQPSNHGSFGQELEALGKMNSSNIMTPLAYTLAADSAFLIYEMSFKGTLFDSLHRSSGTLLDWVSRCSIAVGVAQGLASLHGCSTGPVLLFDLSSKTVLLKSSKEPQIGDIELCKVIDPSKSASSLSAVAGSVGYIPPEYAYTMRVTLAGNVYSFGVILLELLTGKQAVSEGTELAKWVLRNSTQPQKWDRILDFRVSRTSTSVRSQMLAVLKIALACINASSEARPKMKSVLRMLLNAR
ncbi:leucine-rich repeat receptor-like tyrosine-protein kinase PXC3 [Chenopodium quinoa]|uniref:leucine-rich repeat receptor-like tyrosine-protein kinase PXC3 n=1 Tax=Chenopodium quinoa TaxID=63459 RepID=UPI000B78D720|nr:leucine-rich repeat receptor-like tyrosine-protein kinase PXC3 [Chenopodium quinoa]